MSDEKRDNGPGGNGQPGNGPAGNGQPGNGPAGNGQAGNGQAGYGQGGGRRFGRRRFGRGGPKPAAGASPGGPNEAAGGPPPPRPESPLCPLCGKAIYDLSTALSADRETGLPAHFDCIVERIGAAETLGPGERLVYLGSGSFGVVEFKDKSETLFTVKRRVQWEKEGEKKEWRRGLSSRITKI